MYIKTKDCYRACEQVFLVLNKLMVCNYSEKI